MLRLIVVLVLISALSQLRPVVGVNLTARSISGLESLQPQRGLVEIKGTVLVVKLQSLGGSVITLHTADGQQPTLFIAPGTDINLPQFGSYISATGKMIAKGVISVEQIKLLRTPLAETGAGLLGVARVTTSVDSALTGQRISIPVRNCWLQPQLTKGGCFFILFEEIDGTKRTGLLNQTTKIPRQVTMISGYLMNSGVFFIERLS